MQTFTISRSKYLQLSQQPDTLVSVAEKVVVQSAPVAAPADIELPDNAE